MTILITGATGFIGKEFIRRYQDQYNFIALVRKTSDISELKDLKCELKQFEDFSDLHSIFKKKEIRGIVHFAANVLVDHQIQDIKNLIESNITFGNHLLELSALYNVKWFINTGTFWQNYHNKDYEPVNLYAATKEAFENIALFYTETSNLIFTTIKLNDTFGPNDTRKKIFNLWTDIAKTKKKLSMSNGEQIIDISFIDDVLSAYKTLIKHLESSNASSFKNQVFAVKSQERVTLKELATIFEEATNTKLNIAWGEKDYRDREVMIPWTKGNLVPEWKPKYILKDAIKKTIGELSD